MARTNLCISICFGPRGLQKLETRHAHVLLFKRLFCRLLLDDVSAVGFLRVNDVIISLIAISPVCSHSSVSRSPQICVLQT